MLFAGSLLWSCKPSAPEISGTTVGGYPYIIHESNEGPKAQVGDQVYFTVVWRSDSAITLSSEERGQKPRIDIQSTEGDMLKRANPVEQILPLLAEGDSATLVINLDTFPQRPPGFENSDNLYIDLRITEIKPAAEVQAAKEAYIAREAEAAETVKELAQQYREGKLEGQLQATESGLKYVIHEQGQGEHPQAGQAVSVSYYGVLPDGTMFDNSYRTGQPFEFLLGAGQVIQGWDQGIALLKEGGKATFFIPSELAYGATGRGSIPPNSELIFYVELEDILSF